MGGGGYTTTVDGVRPGAILKDRVPLQPKRPNRLGSGRVPGRIVQCADLRPGGLELDSAGRHRRTMGLRHRDAAAAAIGLRGPGVLLRRTGRPVRTRHDRAPGRGAEAEPERPCAVLARPRPQSAGITPHLVDLRPAERTHPADDRGRPTACPGTTRPGPEGAGRTRGPLPLGTLPDGLQRRTADEPGGLQQQRADPGDARHRRPPERDGPRDPDRPSRRPAPPARASAPVQGRFPRNLGRRKLWWSKPATSIRGSASRAPAATCA